jgi:predicted 3-demethylubiquinone-9 3-methyltransferase (glyoxalase superfamily)
MNPVTKGEKVSGRPKGSVMTVAFQLEGQEFTVLNGCPIFRFAEAISLTQGEVESFWRVDSIE